MIFTLISALIVISLWMYIRKNKDENKIIWACLFAVTIMMIVRDIRLDILGWQLEQRVIQLENKDKE